jgi:hypothetical protein
MWAVQCYLGKLRPLPMQVWRAASNGNLGESVLDGIPRRSMA